MAQDGERGVDALVQVEAVQLGLVGSAEAAQAGHELAHAVDGEVVDAEHAGDGGDDTAHLVQLLRRHHLIGEDLLKAAERALERVVIAVERAHGRVQLVCDAGDERAERGQLRGVDERGQLAGRCLRAHRNAWIRRRRMSSSSWLACSSALMRASSSFTRDERSMPLRMISLRCSFSHGFCT